MSTKYIFEEVVRKTDVNAYASSDALVVRKKDIRILNTAYLRMGTPLTVGLAIDKTNSAIRLTTGGPFTVRTKKAKSMIFTISSEPSTRILQPGLYYHAGDNIFVRPTN